MEQSHPRVARGYRIPRFEEMPSRIQDKVHNPNKCTYTARTKRDPFAPPYCGTCNRVVTWFVYKCVKCDDFFIKDFRHPKFCPLYPTCWTHTLENEWERCSEHVPVDEFHDMIVEPLNLNPKKYENILIGDPIFDASV